MLQKSVCQRPMPPSPRPHCYPMTQPIWGDTAQTRGAVSSPSSSASLSLSAHDFESVYGDVISQDQITAALRGANPRHLFWQYCRMKLRSQKILGHVDLVDETTGNGECLCCCGVIFQTDDRVVRIWAFSCSSALNHPYRTFFHA